MGVAWEDLAIVADGHAYTDGGARAKAWAHSIVSMLHAIIVVVLLEQYTIGTLLSQALPEEKEKRKKELKKRPSFSGAHREPQIHKRH